MPRRKQLPSAVEVTFLETPDGLIIDRWTMKVARQAHEDDLRRFIDRMMRDVPGVSLRLEILPQSEADAP